MVRVYQGTFADVQGRLFEDFSGVALPVDVGQWQGLDIKGDPSKVTWEIREAILALRMPETMNGAQSEYRPNLPWAEDHFLERVSGKPLNPPPSNEWWPFAQQGHEAFKKADQFSHTYPERYWPQYPLGQEGNTNWIRWGIRFRYGDLNDVVHRLIKNPYTRQAYLPVWFPEDTGAPEGERVPCSLGYHFMVRQNQVHVTYHIRACDMMRHFRDDVYMTVRLGQWIRDQLLLQGDHEFTMGELTMHIGSFHVFEGDRDMVRYLAGQAKIARESRIRQALA